MRRGPERTARAEAGGTPRRAASVGVLRPVPGPLPATPGSVDHVAVPTGEGQDWSGCRSTWSARRDLLGRDDAAYSGGYASARPSGDRDALAAA